MLEMHTSDMRDVKQECKPSFHKATNLARSGGSGVLIGLHDLDGGVEGVVGTPGGPLGRPGSQAARRYFGLEKVSAQRV